MEAMPRPVESLPDLKPTTPVASKQAARVLPFRPRASSVACAAIHEHGFGDQTTRVLRALAAHARHATPSDQRRWKCAEGEVFSHAKAATVGADLGVTDRSVRRAVRQAREAGLIETRRCSRTRCAYVWKPVS